MATTTPSPLTDRSILLGFCLAALAAIGFSGKAILVKLVYFEPVDAVTLLALRMLFSTPFFLLVALRHIGRGAASPLSGKDYLSILVLGLLGYYMSSLFDFVGLQYISAGLERLILFLYPTMVVVLSAVLLGKSVGTKEAVALLLSYAGIGVVFMHEMQFDSPQVLKGAGFVFASTLTYSAYLIGTGEAVARIGVARFTALAMLVACAATVLQFVLTHPPRNLLLLSARVYQLSAVMAIVSTVLPVFMLSAGIRLIGSGRAALIGSIGPVATLFMAAAILDEPMTPQQIGGAALVMAGVLSLSRK
ncbi:MAG: DMT family transporter [Methylomonas sp.]|jgi:drug/metabolite transporter (DMT)-like permease|uniref:DMT family transporter n=1 Tax=Methylomonas sp. TaxID=418 RepID=UPI0025D274C9|nr:DMT family transporter [Methylomonas sp.]MCK9605965.1 DMT family transporter [Methylomonas sp.]